MNSQRINFCTSLPSHAKYLSALVMASIIFVLVVLLFIVSLFLGIYQFSLYRTEVVEKVAFEKIKQDSQILTQRYPLLASDTPLVNQVKDFAQQIRERREAFRRLTHATLRRGFSEFMNALAQETPATVWLTKIDLNQDSGSMRLSGYTLSADGVSELMLRLARTNPFHDVVFDLFYVKKEIDKPYNKFAIANDDLGQDKSDFVAPTQAVQAVSSVEK